jgi:hypothetical protein
MVRRKLRDDLIGDARSRFATFIGEELAGKPDVGKSDLAEGFIAREEKLAGHR